MRDTLIVGRQWHSDQRMADALGICPNNVPARGIFPLEMRQAHAKQRCLELVEAAVASAVHRDAIFLLPPILAQRAYARSERRVVRRDCARIAQRAQVLRRVEAETADIAKASCARF